MVQTAVQKEVSSELSFLEDKINIAIERKQRIEAEEEAETEAEERRRRRNGRKRGEAEENAEREAEASAPEEIGPEVGEGAAEGAAGDAGIVVIMGILSDLHAQVPTSRIPDAKLQEIEQQTVHDIEKAEKQYQMNQDNAEVSRAEHKWTKDDKNQDDHAHDAHVLVLVALFVTPNCAFVKIFAHPAWMLDPDFPAHSFHVRLQRIPQLFSRSDSHHYTRVWGTLVLQIYPRLYRNQGVLFNLQLFHIVWHKSTQCCKEPIRLD